MHFEILTELNLLIHLFSILTMITFVRDDCSLARYIMLNLYFAHLANVGTVYAS